MKRIFAAFATLLAFIPGFSQKPAHTAVVHPEWSRDAVIYEVNTRQYTPQGTFRAFSAHIPRLRRLGVDILWFMPVHPISKVNRKGPLGSYYAVADYKGVNPEFGKMSDFREVVRQAHKAGMKVIIDWVPNHTGCDNAWVKQHPDFYMRNEEGNMFGPYDWTDVYKLDYSNPALRKAMTDAMAYWIREADIDGFRCDVAGEVPVDFWNKARKELEKVAGRPIFMLAESSDPVLLEKAFDADYNWPMKDLFNSIANTSGARVIDSGDKMPESHACDIDSLLRRQQAEYPAGSYLMNMITNHDMNSWEGTEFDRLGKFARAFAVLTYTLPGMPLLYTGQEIGNRRALEFFSKDNPPEWNTDNDFFDFYRTLNALKHSEPALLAGDKGAPVEIIRTASPDVLAFIRRKGESGVIVAVNLGPEEELVFHSAHDNPKITDAVNVFTGLPAAMPMALASGEFFLATFNPKNLK